MGIRGAGAAMVPLLFVLGMPAAAQVADTLVLSLDQAVAMALAEGEEVGLARVRVDAAGSGIASARAAMLPQVGTALTYTKTFASVFQNTGFELPDSLRFEPDPTAPLLDRVAYLEDMAPAAGLGGLGQLFGNLPFGRENAYLGAIIAEQTLYAGGRVRAGMAMAREGLAAAELQLEATRADLELEVTRAYYSALLARAFEAIADSALQQAETFLEQEQLRLGTGRASELDVLRAQVTADNLRPQRVQATSAAQLAMLNLRRLIDVPDQPIRLTTTLELDADLPPLVAPPDWVEARDARPTLEALRHAVSMREQQVRVARGAFLPAVSLQTTYAKQAFPGGPFDLDTDWLTDWTASLAVALPVFNGGSRFAALQQAHADADAARFQLRQTEELLELEYRQALGDRDRSWAEIASRRRTAELADRVHDLTVLRYDQGLATHLEVSQARLGLLTARTQLAQALADYFIAEATLLRATGGSRDFPR